MVTNLRSGRADQVQLPIPPVQLSQPFCVVHVLDQERALHFDHAHA